MSCGRFTLKHSLTLLLVLCNLKPSCSTECAKCQTSYQNGRCIKYVDGCKVVCNRGFWGEKCQYGRLKLTKKKGHITEGHGNYGNLSKIMWLIAARNGQNSSIYFEIDELFTECTWDHLYIFDGDSIYSPQLAAFSGTFEIGNVNSSHSVIPQVIVAKSGKAYLYFYSDMSVTSAGFNISYSVVENCHCSSNGRCNASGLCSCYPGWSGNVCDEKLFNCSNCVNGVCNETLRQCVCDEGFTGENCDQDVSSSYWTSINTASSDELIAPRASHSSAIIGDWMYVYNGYTSRRTTTIDQHYLFRYHLEEEKWETVPETTMAYRWGHTIATYKNKLILFGGESREKLVDSKLLAIFNVNSSSWSYPSLSTTGKPIAVTGHTATIIGGKMFIIFGLSASGLFPKVQMYDIELSTWEIIEADATFLTPRYGHSSVYDKSTGLIYVYGGLHPERTEKSLRIHPTDSLIAFSHTTRKWSLFPRSGYKQSLHSAALLDGMMLVYGGNPYIDNTKQDIKCHSSKLLAFDFACEQWKSMELSQLPQRLARYGHTAVAKGGTMYIFGGFNGALFNDILTYRHGNCSLVTNKTECLEKYFSAGCFWTNNHTCINRGNLRTCPSNHIPACDDHKSCEECVSSKFNCGWSGATCKVGGNHTCHVVTPLDKCRHKYNCNSCIAAGCSWSKKSICTKKKKTDVSSGCHKACSEYLESSTCLSSAVGCLWCESQKRCIDDKLYVAHFSYGECLEWTTSTTVNKALDCSEKMMCQDCHSLPGCGWCEKDEMTGIGRCTEGAFSGPQGIQCKSWHFIGCPICQCNGHSNCAVNSSVCSSCADHTTGDNCESCAPGYFGNSKNGGLCKRCECNGHGDICDPSSGVCQCNMKGATGKHCESCTESTFVGNATNGGFCYYKLTPDFIYRINVSDRTNFNFISSPLQSDRDTEISVDIIKRNKTFHAKLNISVGSDIAEERFVVINQVLSSKYQETFSNDNYDFGYKNFHFKIYVHDVTPHTSVSISVHQPSDHSINLLQFFIIFLACFIGLLVLAVIFWKAKSTYDAFRLSRRRNVELVYMTNRPFTTIPICVEKPGNLPMKTKPSPLTSEICYGNKAAVATVLIQMPVCAQAQSSSSAGALCLGSTLVTYKEHPGSKMKNYVKNAKRRRNPFRSSPT